MPWEVSRYIS